MNDLIKREDAIDALAEAMPSLTTPDGSGEFDRDIQIADEAFVDAMQIINDLPSADRPQGEWIVSSKDSVCSVCGKDEAEFICGTEDWYGYGLSNYCPNCGAKMKGTKMKGADDASS